MRHELLIEFFSEEIPARFQKKAISDSKEVFEKILAEYGAEFSGVETYVAPRRIAIRVTELAETTKDVDEEKRGPKVSANSSAIDGFLRSNNKGRSDLVERDGYYYLDVKIKGQRVTDIISNIIEDFIAKMPWQKSMRWYVEAEKSLSALWVRPLRSILCVYNKKAIEVYMKSVGITTGDYTFGHRFLAPDKMYISNFEDYQVKLEKSYVMLDFHKKRAYIEREITQLAATMGLCFNSDEKLLDEVAGLVEYPFIHIGSINEKFMSLPPVVLSTSMKVHQKYFSLTYPNSAIAPFFATATNVPGTEVMYDGLERVLRARLSDAMFFYNEDTAHRLEENNKKLKSVVFHEKLGLVAQKVARLISVATTPEEKRTAEICKSDLMTQMVGEFPELQGIMGEIYAQVQGESPVVCKAIREHYKPLGANDILPETATGVRIAFFDKLDNLVGFLGVGIYPTGSKDPFALRRSALCIVRLLTEYNGDILGEKSLDWYISELVSAYSKQGIKLADTTAANVMKFINERYKIYISDKYKIKAEILNTVVGNDGVDVFDYKGLLKQAVRLNELSEEEGFEIVQEAYKRASGIVGNEKVNSDIEGEQYNDAEMVRLKITIERAQKNMDMTLLIEASQSLLNACDNVLIKDKDEVVRMRNVKLVAAYIMLADKYLGIAK